MTAPLGVLGGGSWGTALAVHAAGTGAPVRLWLRDPERAEQLAGERENELYLPGVELPPQIEVTSEIERLEDCETTLVVVPSHGFRAVVRQFVAVCPSDRQQTLISATKGIEEVRAARMSQVVMEEADTSDRQVGFAVLSGPTFAAEMARGTPTAAVVASADPDLAAQICSRLSTSRVRLYSSTDVIGVELGGTCKNVIAIGAGIVTGLELGHNTLAALITRGLHEISRLGMAFGGEVRTFSGLAGLGDLVLTCTGGLSRNRQVGIELARGKTLRQIEDESVMVAEGVRNARTVAELASEAEIEMPITEQMNEVIYGGKSPSEAVRELMSRDLKVESEL